ncbi:isopentenyl-diphosphate Delta-isomerase [Planctomonas sp. JC2975]|uniref:isopentenyl-diphosphate Delta-isomerase n=1 Tax=Planctomonas sp. JC2975 TaxID=2729626 RepID=UPI0014727A0A|nr:isopentenyl-diphosphate Delta-isomerase [Planctomonas sp. JC2975]NNC12684.1 isopentenyl-diphosphate Delta-isomerase [Planctomonas sp. JC2975]
MSDHRADPSTPAVDPTRVVLIDDAGTPIGTAEKASVHGADTPLHLGFSCHVLLEDGRLLVTRRALSKRTFAGVWTNAFCGHPAPGEEFAAAARRHAQHELGIGLGQLELALPDFRYQATDSTGIVEYELCPVFVARAVGDPMPNPEEVAEFAAVTPRDLAAALRSTPWAFSPWLVEQAKLLPLYA